MVALHKTNEGNQATLKSMNHMVAFVQQCIHDLLDNDYLLDGDYGRYVIVADSSGSTFIGDNKQIAPSSVG